MSLWHRLITWIQKGDQPPDIIGDALFRLNKAALVFIALPVLVVLGIVFLVGALQ